MRLVFEKGGYGKGVKRSGSFKAVGSSYFIVNSFDDCCGRGCDACCCDEKVFYHRPHTFLFSGSTQRFVFGCLLDATASAEGIFAYATTSTSVTGKIAPNRTPHYIGYGDHCLFFVLFVAYVVCCGMFVFWNFVMNAFFLLFMIFMIIPICGVLVSVPDGAALVWNELPISISMIDTGKDVELI